VLQAKQIGAKRDKDAVVEGDLFLGTSKSAEGCGASIVFEQATKD